MFRRHRWVQSAVLVIALSTQACGSDDAQSARAVSQLGYGCSVDADCASGVCTQIGNRGTSGICSFSCRADKDCATGDPYRIFSCGIGEGQERLCLPDCKRGGAYGGDPVCVDEVTTACAVAPESACQQCGCAKSTDFCVSGVGCVELKQVGEPCEGNHQCASSSCSPIAKVCRVPTGSPCTSADCDMCLTAPSGYSYCSRQCTGRAECPGNLCLSDPALSSFAPQTYTCRPPCGNACPGACEYPLSDPQLRYCACAGCTVAR